MSTGRMQRVKAALRTRDELCAMSDLYAAALANGRNDLSTLEREFKWEIKKTWATHDQAHHRHYQLVREGRTTRAPRRAIQQRLLTT